jgi:hypothetical protein
VAGNTTPPALSLMQRSHSNKPRPDTLTVTAVPVTALGVVVGTGIGAPLLLCGPLSLALGLVLGALLSAAIGPTEPTEARGPHTFGVRALLARAAHETRPALHDVDVRVDVAPAKLSATGHPECLHRAVADLIVQAARRSPPGGVVTVAARSAADGVRLEVVDEGSGDCAAGLADARRIVHRHGGAMRTEAARPYGCRVVVDLPGV